MNADAERDPVLEVKGLRGGRMEAFAQVLSLQEDEVRTPAFWIQKFWVAVPGAAVTFPETTSSTVPASIPTKNSQPGSTPSRRTW